MIYFVHIPKTAGITLKTYLENHITRGTSLVIDEQAARALPAEDLRGYELLSGHYSSEVLEAVGRRPDVTLMLVREPMARMRSWSAHCRRVSDLRYRTIFEGRTDLEAMHSEGGYTCHQAYWMARALRDGAASTRVPDGRELPALVGQVDVVGLTEEIERFKQVLAYRMGWPAPPLGWHINRRPDAQPEVRTDEEREMQRLLATDETLYALVAQRFWMDYAAMVRAIDPARPALTPEEAAHVPVSHVQEALLAHHRARQSTANVERVTRVDVTGEAPLTGEGWWWRECPKGLAYRWTGPAVRSTLLLPPLEPTRVYDLTIELMGAADWDVWDGSRLEINGTAVRTIHERFGPRASGGVSLRLHARIDPALIARRPGSTELALSVPETKQALSHVVVLESFDTYNRDLRAVGLAVRRVTIDEAA